MMGPDILNVLAGRHCRCLQQARDQTASVPVGPRTKQCVECSCAPPVDADALRLRLLRPNKRRLAAPCADAMRSSRLLTALAAALAACSPPSLLKAAGTSLLCIMHVCGASHAEHVDKHKATAFCKTIRGSPPPLGCHWAVSQVRHFDG
jgi:hypothetical protein